MEINSSTLLTVRDIQDIFGFGKNYAYALMHADGFPSIQINKRIYVSKDAFEKWLDQQRGKRFSLCQ